jgi:uncharacterized protein with HEPN domain
MSSKVEEASLRDILHHIGLVQQFTAELDYEAFNADTLRVYAVVRCLEIISEASRRLSDDLKARHPAITWKEMAGAGSIYRHDYQDVASRRIWDTARLALPPLRAVVLTELSRFPSDE